MEKKNNMTRENKEVKGKMKLNDEEIDKVSGGIIDTAEGCGGPIDNNNKNNNSSK